MPNKVPYCTKLFTPNSPSNCVLTEPDGREYRGGFRRGRCDGRGRIIYPDGRSIDVRFEDGRQVE